MTLQVQDATAIDWPEFSFFDGAESGHAPPAVSQDRSRAGRDARRLSHPDVHG